MRSSILVCLAASVAAAAAFVDDEANAVVIEGWSLPLIPFPYL